MRLHQTVVAGILIVACVFRAGVIAAPAPAPATAPDAATQPAGMEMTCCIDKSIGMSFDRPAGWKPSDDARSGDASIAFAEPGLPVGRVQAHIQISIVDAPGMIAKIDTTAPPDPGVTASRIFTIDGVPARLTAFKMPPSVPNTEMLTVQIAKGSRSYTITIIYPSEEHNAYVAMANAVCASIKLLPKP